jgi:hypothetical protein
MAGDTRRRRLLAGLHVPPWLWPAARGLLVAAIVAAVAWEFSRILRRPELWTQSWQLRPGLLATAAALYLGGLGFSVLYWNWLLRVLGQRPRALATLRAYYVGQLGRYVPGKVAAVAIRARLLAGPGVRPGAALLTVVYEALTTVASAVLLGLLLIFRDPDHAALGWRGLVLLAVVGVLLWPGVFNHLAERMTRRFRQPGAGPLPQVGTTTLVAGLGLDSCGWWMQGAVLWALVESLAPGAWPSPWAAWSRCTACVTLAYAAGFLVLASPGGLGVRDFLSQHFLAEDLAPTLGAQAAGVAVAAAISIRLLWTVLDVAAATLCYWLPDGPPDEPAARARGSCPE